MPKHPDFPVIGGGIIGGSIARRFRTVFEEALLTVPEKERALGMRQVEEGMVEWGVSPPALLYPPSLKECSASL